MIAVATALGAAAPSARADSDRRVGLVVTLSVNLSDDDARALATELAVAIRDKLGIDVIAGAEADRRLPPEGLPDECIGDPSCRNDLGRRLDADELLLLVVVKMGYDIHIDATWANVASGRTSSRPRVELTAGADRNKLLRDAVPLLLPHIKRDAAPASPQFVVVTRDGGDSGHRMTTPTWIATGVAGAGLIGGTVFALSARNKFDGLEQDECRLMQCTDDRIDGGKRHALYADILFGTALAAGTTAVVLYLMSGPDPAEAPKQGAPTVTAIVGDGTVGLGIGGAF